MKNKKIDKTINLFREERKKELFGDKTDLTQEDYILLQEYEQDYLHPIWKDIIIDGNSTNYKVSNIGQVCNKSTGKILKSGINDSGYSKINIYMTDRATTKKIHRLVAQAFIPNPENKREVNHINGIKTCNWYKNLEWVTPKENKQHAIRMGLYDNASFTKKGIERSQTKYSEELIHKICKDISKFHGPKYISEKYNVSRGIVSAIKRGRAWRHISKNYKFPPKHLIRLKKYKDMNKSPRKG